ncbi:50S ribosomal protein L31 [bioreactor metagenome]|uniref:Large ribosomal subunit protein bL31 n=1 Tax=bioreactor metagenome TaxID=1076179 RepID=A0A644YWS2_9ZZZZ
MRKGIHPTYYPDAKVTCSCGNTWNTGSTRKEIHTEVCSKCHPFFTGQQQRLIDIEGQVDRFYKKLQARQEFVDQKKARETSKTSLDKTVQEIGLPARASEALVKAGLTTVGQIITKLGAGEAALLEIDGFGRKSLIDMKKLLRAQGYELPAAADDIAV